jgi:hypothetical protein
MQTSFKRTYWVTNTCSMNVSLADLNLTIKAYSSVNLLDGRHYNYTLEQLQKSALSGSIFKKRDKIVLRQNAPVVLKNKLVISESFVPSRGYSLFNIKHEEYDELKISEEDDKEAQKKLDEEYAKENADLAQTNEIVATIKKGGSNG